MDENNEALEYVKGIIDGDELKPSGPYTLFRTFGYTGFNYRGAFEDMFDKDNSDNQTLCTSITCRDGAWNVLYFKNGLLYDIHLDIERSYCLKENKFTRGDLKCNGYKQIFELSSIKHYLNPTWNMDYDLGKYQNYGTSSEINDKAFYESLSPKQQDFLRNTKYFMELNMTE